MESTLQIPEAYQRDIRRAVEILKAEGCNQVFLFGSLTAGTSRQASDIDLAIRGCPNGKFFHLLGKLLLGLEHPVDLVNLDTSEAFAHHLGTEDELLQIG
jgi:predicted nucleotidyltransferase